MTSKFYFFIFLCLLTQVNFAQDTKISSKVEDENIVVQDTVTREPINPLSPAKAAFYSAILPGLGQAYNKRYWKIPIIYAALGTSIYFYVDNNKQYKRYRDAYKRRLAGFTDDEFWGEGSTPNISNDGLTRAQDTYRRNQELSLLITVGIYALNIIDANVDAHLLQFNVDENLALKPHFEFNQQDASTNLGLTLGFKF